MSLMTARGLRDGAVYVESVLLDMLPIAQLQGTEIT